MPRLRKAERLRRERISRSLRAYHREQRRLREVRAEASRRYWRRVKQAAGRHDLTLRQARRTVRLADQRAIPVFQAARRVKPVRVRVPPAPPPPLPPLVEWRSPVVTREELAFNLRDRVDARDVPDPRDVLRRTGTVEADFDLYVDGRFKRTQTVEFESSPSQDDFWYNFHAAAREALEDIQDEEVEYDQISITAMALRMA